MALVAGGTAPYTSPASVIEVLTRYRERGMTTPFTKEVLERAGIPATLSGRTMQALKILDFVDGEGNPTDAFRDVSRAPDAEYKQRLGEMLCATYADVLSFADPATDSYDRVRDAFRAFDPRGQQERMVTLFLGLLDHVGLDTSGASGSRKSAPREPGAAQKVQPSRRTSGTRKPAEPSKGAKKATGAISVIQGDLPPGLVGLLHQIPRDGKGWTEDRRDSFLQAFRSVLDFSVPITEFDPYELSDDEEDDS